MKSAKLLLTLGNMVLMSTRAALAATETQDVLAIQHWVTTPAVERDDTRPATSLRSTWVKTLQKPDARYELFYAVDDLERPDRSRLIAIEKWDPQGTRLISFRHSHTVSDSQRWSPWLPGSLKDSTETTWPDLRNPERNVESRAIRPVNAQLLDTSSLDSANLDALDSLPELDPMDWSRGTKTWSFDPAKWEPWSGGYLWDFKNGWLWRGYRKSDDSSEVLTPSQNQTSDDPSRIRDYYMNLSPTLTTGFTSENTRWLSPLDKWGVWANRKFGQTWWHAAAWEGANHHTNMEWGGYCNGAAAASILWKRPRHSFVSQNVLFDPRDVAGLMQIASYKVDLLFYGKRYHGPTSDLSEPRPDYVIDVLRAYLGAGTPIVFDWEAGSSVGNLVALKATVKVEDTDNKRLRKGTLSILQTGNLDDDGAVAKKNEKAAIPAFKVEDQTQTRTFEFWIDLDENGKVTQTRWKDDAMHPDFLWVPTGNRDFAPPNIKNPYLKIDRVLYLIEQSQEE